MAHAATHLRLIPPLPADAPLPVWTRDRTLGETGQQRDAGKRSRAARRHDPDLDSVSRSMRGMSTVVLRVLGRDHGVDDVACRKSSWTAMTRLAAVRSRRRCSAAGQDDRGAQGLPSSARRRRLRGLLGFDRELLVGEHWPPPAAAPEERATRPGLQRADRLPVAERVCLDAALRRCEQIEALAAMCGCSLATAKRRIAAAPAWKDSGT